ncbi:MAG: GNAT family N-acetyltransferase [Anaerolineales bacterium]|nr:GNAT family N-acetyltransferase [Anaerolineales bacterium]
MIFGERIRFRSIEREDLPHFVAWFNDPEVRAGLGLYLPLSQVEEEAWFDDLQKRAPDERPLSIEVRQSSTAGDDGWILIGDCGLLNIDQRNRSAELGIMIGDKTFWNRGYGTEAVRLLVKHGFQTLNLHRIFLRVFETNPRAIRSYEKAGFVSEGRQRQAEFRGGKYIDVIVMSMLDSEYDHAGAS